ncbi:hypothetical protein Bbelb_261420 [Branchiostoma belcheri]|nr:hypothetical protein Bbelb_261420 [Branchiostoma belcheri]
MVRSVRPGSAHAQLFDARCRVVWTLLRMFPVPPTFTGEFSDRTKFGEERLSWRELRRRGADETTLDREKPVMTDDSSANLLTAQVTEEKQRLLTNDVDDPETGL